MVVPPSRRGSGHSPPTPREASAGPPERFRKCSTLANPHAVKHQLKVGQGEQAHQLCRVPGQSPVPHVHVPELALHPTERNDHPGR